MLPFGNVLVLRVSNNNMVQPEPKRLTNMFIKKFLVNDQKTRRPGILVKTFKEGAVYEGQLNNQSQRHGKGLFRYKENQDLYFGDWKNDKFHGKGVYIFTKGDRYSGDLREGRKAGYGDYFYANGNIYKGQWLGDRKHGEGRFLYANTNEEYEGMDNQASGSRA